MRLKNVVLLVIFLVYGGYYVGISKGYIKKHSIAGQEGDRNFIQQVIGVITPDSPAERRIELSEKLEVLKMHLAMAEDNLANYEKWRANVIANPPT